MHKSVLIVVMRSVAIKSAMPGVVIPIAVKLCVSVLDFPLDYVRKKDLRLSCLSFADPVTLDFTKKWKKNFNYFLIFSCSRFLFKEKTNFVLLSVDNNKATTERRLCRRRRRQTPSTSVQVPTSVRKGEGEINREKGWEGERLGEITL